jgi:hypothetical protein
MHGLRAGNRNERCRQIIFPVAGFNIPAAGKFAPAGGSHNQSAASCNQTAGSINPSAGFSGLSANQFGQSSGSSGVTDFSFVASANSFDVAGWSDRSDLKPLHGYKPSSLCQTSFPDPFVQGF